MCMGLIVEAIMWGNVCGVGPSKDLIKDHIFDWVPNKKIMLCSKCGFTWNGKSRWFGGESKIYGCMFLSSSYGYLGPLKNIFPTRLVSSTWK